MEQHEGNTLTVQLKDYMPLLNDVILSLMKDSLTFRVTGINYASSVKVTGFSQNFDDVHARTLISMLLCQNEASGLLNKDYRKPQGHLRENEDYLPRPDNNPDWVSYIRIVHEGTELALMEL